MIRIIKSAVFILSLACSGMGAADEPTAGGSLDEQSKEDSTEFEGTKHFQIAFVAPILTVRVAQGAQVGWFIKQDLALDYALFGTFANKKDKSVAFSLFTRETFWQSQLLKLRYFFHKGLYFSSGFSKINSGDVDWISYERYGVDFSFGGEHVDPNGFTCGIDFVSYSHKLSSKLRLSQDFKEQFPENSEPENFARDAEKAEKKLRMSPFGFFAFKFGYTF